MSKPKLKSLKDKLGTYIFFILFILILIYFIFRVYNYLSGPKITINSPTPYTIINSDTFIIEGHVENAKNIYLNGREINIEKNGNFIEKIIAKSPYTLITLQAVDRYGKSSFKTMSIGKE